MTQSREPNDRDIYTRVAELEYRLTRIENTNAQLQATIAPVLLRLHGRETRPKRTAGGYITDAFERVVDRIDEVEDRLNARMDERFTEVSERFDEVNRRFDEVNRRFDSQDAKFDTILRHITGLGNS